MRDKAAAWFSGDVVIDVPAMSVVQLIFTPDDLSAATELQIREETFTPGSIVEGLRLYQTTRLRAIARYGDFLVDVTNLNAVWESSQPEYVRVDSCGLVQRLRMSDGPVTIRAKILNGPSAEVILSATVGG